MIQFNFGKGVRYWLALVLFVLAFNHSAQAVINSQVPSDSKAIQQENNGKVLRAKKLDRLFAGLKVASTEQDARRIEGAIWRLWLSSDNRLIAQKMQVIMAAREARNFEGAITLLNDLISQYPDYS